MWFCMLSVLFCDTVKHGSAHTIGVEFSSRTLRIGDKTVKLQVGDCFDMTTVVILADIKSLALGYSRI